MSGVDPEVPAATGTLNPAAGAETGRSKVSVGSGLID
jgi:hypothetical protein